MDIHIQVTQWGERLSLSDALKHGEVIVINDYMRGQNGTSMSLSSRLFDCKGNEIFENDVVRTTTGKQYIVIYNFGVFCLKNLDDKSIIPLYIYKLGNTIDVEKLQIN